MEPVAGLCPLLLEGALFLVLLAVCAGKPAVADRFFTGIENWLRKADTPLIKYLLVAAVAVVARGMLLTALPPSLPDAVPDEFSTSIGLAQRSARTSST